MKELGEKIKEIRRAKGLTQKDLAEGICTQATISNLENGASFPALGTLLAIADRLNIDFNEIYEYTTLNSNGYSDVFKRIRSLFGQSKHKEAYELIKNEIDFDKLETAYEIKQYYYYMGITSLLGAEDFSDALYNFNLALFSANEKKLDFLDVLSTNGIGIAYFKNNDSDKAKTYFEKSLNQLGEIIDSLDSLQDSIEVTKVYYNTASFYARVGEYKKALELAELGIKLQQSQNTSYCLDLLLYEKAYNLLKLEEKEESKKYYFYAAALADFNQNPHLMEVIKKDMKDYKITGYKYW